MPQTFFGKYRAVGIDIGFNTVKVVELAQSGQEVRIVNSNMIGIPPQIVSKNGIAKKKELAEAIGLSLRQAQPHPIRLTSVVTALPESYIFSKVITLPDEIKKNEIHENVLLEISEFLPWPADESYIDWQYIPALNDDKRTALNIFVVAAPKKLVDDFTNVIIKAGLELEAIETKPIASARAVIEKNNNKPLMIVDIGAEHSSASVAVDTIIRFSSTIPIGANAAYFDRTNAKAPTLLKKPDPNKVGEPLVENIVNNIHYYNARIHNQAINEVRLCGGGSNLPQIDELITKGVGIKTTRANPAVNFHSKTKYDPVALQIFTVAIGLAMRGLER